MECPLRSAIALLTLGGRERFIIETSVGHFFAGAVRHARVHLGQLQKGGGKVFLTVFDELTLFQSALSLLLCP